MRGEILRTLADQAAGVVQLLIGQRGIKAGHHDVGLFLVTVQERNASFAEVVAKILRADEIDAFSRSVADQKFSRHVARGHDLVRGGLKAEAGQLVQIHLGGTGGVVGKEKHALACLAEAFNEADRKGEDAVAKVNGPVHIKNIQLFLLEDREGGILKLHTFPPLIIRSSLRQGRKRSKARCSDP